MPDMELGVLHRFKVEGLEKLTQAVKGLDSVSSAADRFIQKTFAFGIAAGAMTAAGYVMLKPFTMLGDAAMTTGSDFEKMYLQIKNVSGGSEEASKKLYDFLSMTATESPFAFRELLGAMREFKYLGLDVQKTYGDIYANIGDKTQKFTATAITALSGLAAATGADLNLIKHHVATAIKSGRADYLEYYLGPIKMIQMQLSGAFIGTYQQQFDKIMRYFNKEFGRGGIELAQTMSSIKQGFTDLMEAMWVALTGAKTKGSWYKALENLLGNLQLRLVHFFQEPIRDVTMLDRLGKIVTQTMMPLVKLAEYIFPKMVSGIEKLSNLIVNPKFSSFFINLGKFAMMGGALVAIGALLTGLSAIGALIFSLGSLPAFLPMLLGLTVGSIGAIGAFGSLTKNWHELKTTFKSIFNEIQKDFEWFFALTGVLFESWIHMQKSGVTYVSEELWQKLDANTKKFAQEFMGLEWLTVTGKPGGGFVEMAKSLGGFFVQGIEKSAVWKNIGTKMIKELVIALNGAIDLEIAFAKVMIKAASKIPSAMFAIEKEEIVKKTGGFEPFTHELARGAMSSLTHPIGSMVRALLDLTEPAPPKEEGLRLQQSVRTYGGSEIKGIVPNQQLIDPDFPKTSAIRIENINVYTTAATFDPGTIGSIMDNIKDYVARNSNRQANAYGYS